MSKRDSDREKIKKGPMPISEIEAMREKEGIVFDAEVDVNTYAVRSGEEKLSLEIGKAFRQARKEMGMTQQEGADASGVKRPNIARLESGKHSPTVDMLNHIADSMGMDLEIRLVERESK